jgi:hypothetical protein
MRCTAVFDFRTSLQSLLISNTAENENTINLIFYTAENVTDIKLIISGGTLANPVEVTGFAANSICFYSIPASYYPQTSNSLYVQFSDSSKTSAQQEFYFPAYKANAYIRLEKNTLYNNLYSVYYSVALSSAEVVEQLEENTRAISEIPQMVQNISRPTAADVASTLSGIIPDELLTNILPYILHTDYTYDSTSQSVTKNSNNYVFVNTPSGSRQFVNIAGGAITFNLATYTTGTTYTGNVQPLTIGGKTVYYTSINGCNNFAYNGFTFNNPSSAWAGLTLPEDAFIVYVPDYLTTLETLRMQYTVNVGAEIKRSYYDGNGNVYPMGFRFADGTSAADGGGIYFKVPWAVTNGYESLLRPIVIATSISDTKVTNAPDGSIIFIGAVSG